MDSQVDPAMLKMRVSLVCTTLLLLILLVPPSLQALEAEGNELLGLLRIMISDLQLPPEQAAALSDFIGQAEYSAALSALAKADRQASEQLVLNIRAGLEYLQASSSDVYRRSLDAALESCQLDGAEACATTLRTRATIYFDRGELDLAENTLSALVANEGVSIADRVDDLDLIMRIYLRQGNLARADFSMEMMLDVAEKVEKSNPALAFKVYEHCVRYIGSRWTRSNSLKSNPVSILERYLELGRAQVRSDRPRILLLMNYLQLGELIGLSDRRLKDVLDEFSELLRVMEVPVKQQISLHILVGDGYIKIDEPALAEDHYLLAFGRLVQTEIGEARDQFFATPHFLGPQRIRMPGIIKSAPSKYEGGPIYIDFVFTVNADGRARNIEVADANVPTKLIRYKRDQLKRAYFRPRLEETGLLASPAARMRFEFRLLDELPGIEG